LKERQQIILILIIGTLLFLLLTVFLVVFVLAYKRRQLNHMLEKAALQHTFENQLLQSRLETQEQTFKYFSEEIHDNVGQVLSVVGMHLYQLQIDYSSDKAVTLLHQSSSLLNKAIDDLRTISHTLNAQYINKSSLAEVVQTEISYITSVRDLNCELHIKGEEKELPPDRQTLLFRIIQEALGNALKHAAASSIHIYLIYGKQDIEVRIVDDGKGFSVKKNNGIGLGNMQQRAGLLGGELKIDSVAGEGTTLSLTVLFNRDH
jgi:two-component system NarL family sensor kinase